MSVVVGNKWLFGMMVRETTSSVSADSTHWLNIMETSKTPAWLKVYPEKKSFGGIPNSRNVLFLQIFLKRASKPSAGTFSETLLNLTWLHQSLPDLLGTFSGTVTPVEPDLALHQSLPDLLRNLLRNPVEPDLALHQSLPDLLQKLLPNPVELDLALHQGFLEPSPEPCWTPRLPGTFSGTFSETLLHLDPEPIQKLSAIQKL